MKDFIRFVCFGVLMLSNHCFAEEVLIQPAAIAKKIVDTSCHQRIFANPYFKANQLAGIPISRIVVNVTRSETQQGSNYGFGFSHTSVHQDLTIVTPTWTSTYRDCISDSGWQRD